MWHSCISLQHFKQKYNSLFWMLECVLTCKPVGQADLWFCWFITGEASHISIPLSSPLGCGGCKLTCLELCALKAVLSFYFNPGWCLCKMKILKSHANFKTNLVISKCLQCLSIPLQRALIEILFNTCLMCLPSFKQVIRARGTISSQAIDSLLVILGEKGNEDKVLVLLSVLIWT